MREINKKSVFDPEEILSEETQTDLKFYVVQEVVKNLIRTLAVVRRESDLLSRPSETHVNAMHSFRTRRMLCLRFYNTTRSIQTVRAIPCRVL